MKSGTDISSRFIAAVAGHKKEEHAYPLHSKRIQEQTTVACLISNKI